MKLLAAIALVACSLTLVIASGSEYSYDLTAANGPSRWGTVSATCDAKSQSPIDIKPGDATVNEDLGKFEKSQFASTPTSMKLQNNGHSIKVGLGDGYTLPDRMGGLPGIFQAAQFHFHWGQETGSEHTLDGKQYFGEMHIVHINSIFNMTASNALGQPSGLAVLGFFVTADAAEDNAAFASIVDKLSEVPNKDDATDLAPFPVGNLMPANIDNFFRYNGSLTTPPCSEHVTWTMFDSTIAISPAQAKEFKDFTKITGNFRPVQALNSRVVSKNFEDGGNGGNSVVAPGKMSLAAMLIMVTVNLIML